MKLYLIIKIIKNPYRAYAAFVRRAHVFFRRWYFWLRFHCSYLPHSKNIAKYDFPPLIPDHLIKYDQAIIDCAYSALDVYGDFLGVQINDPLPPWHEDVRLRPNNCTQRFFSKAWYSAIKISPHLGNDLGPDIKVPWMLGRLNHVTLWAYAYYHTRDAIFLTKCTEHMEDFLIKNPPYFGVQWTCTMEIALRSINIILIISLLDDLPKILKHRLHTSLMDHRWYILNHWELYDGKTNNHYLSNLVGYWCLCSFFNMDKEQKWCAEQLIQEVEKQQLHDGAFYEGSTAYHRLSTDLIAIALALDKDDLLYPLSEKYKRMEEVDNLFEYDENQRVFIGDNDSSPVLHPQLLKLIRPGQQSLKGTFSLPQFGLDIYKNNSLHVTLRHHVYNAGQPTGHFHDDCNALTLAIHKTACIVDPGTYVYTSNVSWRNTFRDVSVHGTCYLHDRKKKWPDCFANNINVQKYKGTHFSTDICSILAATCSCHGFVHERFVHINESQKIIKLIDYIKNDSSTLIWQLPIRGVIVQSADTVIEFNTDGVIWQIHGKEKWCINQSSYAPSYGILEPIIYISLLIDMPQNNIETYITWR